MTGHCKVWFKLVINVWQCNRCEIKYVIHLAIRGKMHKTSLKLDELKTTFIFHT